MKFRNINKPSEKLKEVLADTFKICFDQETKYNRENKKEIWDSCKILFVDKIYTRKSVIVIEDQKIKKTN